MTIAELHGVLDRMRKIYAFDDEKTNIRLERNPIKAELSVYIDTYDEDEDISVELNGTSRYWKVDGTN